MVMVAGVAGWLGKGRVRRVLHDPVIVINVPALDLMGGGCGTPEEGTRKGDIHESHSSLARERHAAKLKGECIKSQARTPRQFRWNRRLDQPPFRGGPVVAQFPSTASRDPLHGAWTQRRRRR